MKPSRLIFPIIAAIVFIPSTFAGDIDMDDPRRTVGREDNVRVDAQLIQDTVSPGSPIGITYQIENSSSTPVALADKVLDASYDSDSRTITVSIGSEVPVDGKMPHVVTIAPGEKKVFRAGVTPALGAAAARSSLAPPRYVQIKVSILRDLDPFAQLIARQSGAGQVLTDELFDRWFESNDTIFLNAVPVRFSAWRNPGEFSGAEHRGNRGRQ
ncbi:MAG: hypothetical protein M3P06_21630 [Acidobacteriota bacterium]|nr:hypothetical protein [Acidobacteriota bacterium]